MSYEYLNMLCTGCFSRLETTGIVCPHCGYDNSNEVIPEYQLPPRTILGGKYMLGKVLGEGGFGITYIAYDLNMEVVVAVKEYYPSGLVTRSASESMTVRAFGGEYADIFRKGRDCFVDEAKRLTRLRALPGIVMVTDFLVENGTAYIVMEFVLGQTLKSYLTQMGGRLPPEQVFKMLEPVFGSLAQIHESGIIHRDISPDNIMITPDGSVTLLDFGAAREFDEKVNKSLSVLLKHGYAPMEQYSTKGVQGPFTDVYALSATIYKAITGVTPESSMDRVIEDIQEPPSKLGIVLPSHQEAALMKGLAVRQPKRFQTVSELQAALYGVARTGISELLPPDTPPPNAPPSPDMTQKTSKSALITVIAIIAVFVIGFVVWIILRGPSTPEPPAPEPVSPAPEPVSPAPTAISPTEEPPITEEPALALEPPSPTVTDSEWMQMYYDEMRVALDYPAENNGWGHPDMNGRHPLDFYEFMLIDLNFDGVPELIIYGDGAASIPGMWLFSVSENSIELIYDGLASGIFIEGDLGKCMSKIDWQLYRKSDDGSFAYFLFLGPSSPLSMHELEGDILIIENSTNMEYGFKENAKIAEIYVITQYSVDEDSTGLYFNTDEVSENEFCRLIDSLVSGYEHIPFTPHALRIRGEWWEEESISITDDDLWDFLNGYLDLMKSVDWYPATN